jgi:hypothetical protein
MFGEKELIPLSVRKELHNIPVTKKSGIVIDLIEYRDLDHVGVRTYQNDLAKRPIEGRLAAFEHANLIVQVLRSHGISAALEKVEGSPPRTEGV